MIPALEPLLLLQLAADSQVNKTHPHAGKSFTRRFHIIEYGSLALTLRHKLTFLQKMNEATNEHGAFSTEGDEGVERMDGPEPAAAVDADGKRKLPANIMINRSSVDQTRHEPEGARHQMGSRL